MDLPPAPPPAPGTEVELTGTLDPDRLGWRDLMLDDVALEDALATALELDPRTPRFRARITVRVLDQVASDVSEADDEAPQAPR